MMEHLKLKKNMSAFVCGACLLMGSCLPLPAQAADGARVISPPAGVTLPTQEGATAAPVEINHNDSIYFAQPDFYEMRSDRNLVLLPHYQTYQQTTEYTCGPAAGLTVMYYYGRRDFDEMSLAKGMKTEGYPIGTSTSNMAAFFRGLGWQVETAEKPMETYEEFQAFVLQNLRRQRPILVENVEWGGHWRVIIGYDNMGTDSSLDDTLILADPYDTCDHWQDGYVISNGQKFFSMWFDHNMLPEEQRTQPWIVTYPAGR